MKLTYLDIDLAHGGHPCRANRFAMLPSGQWQCIDCGVQIPWTTLDVSEASLSSGEPGTNEVADAVKALRRKMDNTHPDDIGDGLRNKVNDLLWALSGERNPCGEIPLGMNTLPRATPDTLRDARTLAVLGPWDDQVFTGDISSLVRRIYKGLQTPLTAIVMHPAYYSDFRRDLRNKDGWEVVTSTSVIKGGVMAYLHGTPVMTDRKVKGVVVCGGPCIRYQIVTSQQCPPVTVREP